MKYSVDELIDRCPGHEAMIKCIAGSPALWVGLDGSSQLIEKMEYLYLRRCEEFLYKYRFPQENIPEDVSHELMKLKGKKQKILEVVLTAIEKESGSPGQCASRNSSLSDLELSFDELF